MPFVSKFRKSFVDTDKIIWKLTWKGTVSRIPKNQFWKRKIVGGIPLFSFKTYQFSSVQLLSRVQLIATPWITSQQASVSITNSRSLLKLRFIESVMPSSHLILCCPLLLLPPFPPSIRVFSNESTLHIRWPKYWSFSFSISPSSEHPGLISFRMDWLDLLAVQGTLKSLLQHHSSKVSILGAQLSSQSNSHIHTWPLEKLWPWPDGLLLAE